MTAPAFDAVPLLQALVRAAAEGPGAVAARLAESLAPLGFVEASTRAAPTAWRFARGEAVLAFSGHVDVVPAGEGWSVDPFGGVVRGGCVWGRGACDMLGGVAAFAAAAARVPEAPCALVLTSDEETGMRAAEAALDEGLLRGLARVVVGEPTRLRVGIAEKGVLWMRVRTRGRHAHASMPRLGDNAAERLVRILPRLLAVRGGDAPHPLLGEATASLGRLVAGEAVNQIPAQAWADIDARFLPGVDALARYRDALAAAGEPAELEVLSLHAPFETPAEAPLAREALAAAAHAGRPGSPIGLPYGTEASKYAPAGHACVLLGPGDPALAHTSEERIALDDLRAGVAAYAWLLAREAAR